jgi:hypothetical protein
MRTVDGRARLEIIAAGRKMEFLALPGVPSVATIIAKAVPAVYWGPRARRTPGRNTCRKYC